MNYPMAEQTTTAYSDVPKTNGNRMREVPKAFDELALAQKYTSELLQQLYERTAPALGPSPPQEAGETPAYPKSVPLASSIYDVVQTQQNFNNQLRDILARLEL